MASAERRQKCRHFVVTKRRNSGCGLAAARKARDQDQSIEQKRDYQPRGVAEAQVLKQKL
jgi:hypothetical protein